MYRCRFMLHRKISCQSICILLVLAYLLLNYERKQSFELKIKKWDQYDSDKSFNQLRNACLSGKGLLHDERNVSIGTKGLQYNTMDDAVNVARTIQKYYNVVLVSVINDAYLAFAYSWLCNTAEMDIHKSLLIITFDTTTRDNLITNWDKINVIALDIDDTPVGDQVYSRAGYVKIMIRRTRIMYSLLKADINLFLLEFDYVWFSNPLPELKNMSDIDILINPVSLRNENVINGGLILIYATERSKFLWKKLSKMMTDLRERIKSNSVYAHVSESENDQVYFSKLVRERYGNITTRKLPLDRYADGVWYMLNDEERRKTKPVMISNNYIEGNINKMKRAKLWEHWFLLENCTCDIQAVWKIQRGAIQ